MDPDCARSGRTKFWIDSNCFFLSFLEHHGYILCHISLFTSTAFSLSFFFFCPFVSIFLQKKNEPVLFFFFYYSFFWWVLISYLKIKIEVSRTINFKTEDSVFSLKLWVNIRGNAEPLVPDVGWLLFRLFGNKAVEIWKILEKKILIVLLEFVFWHFYVLSCCISSRTYPFLSS